MYLRNILEQACRILGRNIDCIKNITAARHIADWLKRLNKCCIAKTPWR